MNKINILYDASSLVDSMNSKKVSRAGIFWCAYNILYQLGKSPLYNVILLVPPEVIFKFNSALKKYIFSFPVVLSYEQSKYIINIEVHKNAIKNTKNVFFIFLRLLKILKNFLLIQLSKKKKTFSEKIDVYFSPVYTIPDRIKNDSRIKSFQFLHDCIPSLKNIPLGFNLENNHWYNKMIDNLNENTYYFCNSECTKNDFLGLFPEKLDKNKMFVTPIASSQSFFPNYDKSELKNTLKKHDIIHKPDDCYIFSLCSVDPRKNLIFTIKCFISFIIKHKINNMYFFLGGGQFPEYIDQFNREISEFNNYRNKIIHLGYVDDNEVNILYSNSLFFVYLSQYEGFGMPVLEAMQAGTPVICSNNSSLPEVADGSAITITYNDEEACIKAFEDFYFNETLRREYIEKGIERAALFSWEKTFQLISGKITEIASVDNSAYE